MNKVITVNLNGIAYQLEESGFEALRNYLASASAKLGGNPDRDEIIADIEQAIGDKFRGLLGSHKNVVTVKEVEAVIGEMGAVEDGSATGAESSTSAKSGPTDTSSKAGAATPGEESAPPKRARRLYRLNEGAMLAGVCTGLEAFTGIDVIAFRAAFAVLTVCTFGLGILVYVLMMFVVPQADSATERSEAQGPMPTAQDFIRRAREGYYEATKGFPNKQARREWKRKFKQDMRDWKQNFRWEMRANSCQWQQNWGHYWSQTAARWPLMLICGAVSLVLFILCLCGVVSLITTGTIVGFSLPTGMPVWVGILLLILFFQILSLPFRAIRRATCGWPCGRCDSGFSGILLLALVVGLAWWLYPDQTKAIINEIPPTLHHAMDTVRDWWSSH